jgi:acylphosphatase
MPPGADGTSLDRGLRESEGMATDDVVRRRLIIRGRVQGVFFRDSIRERAEAHGVAGWVRNRPDGTVEAVFEGPRESVETLVRFSETGPEYARVEAVEVVEEGPAGDSGFRVG